MSEMGDWTKPRDANLPQNETGEAPCVLGLLVLSPHIISIMQDGQSCFGDRAQSDRIIERLEQATGLSVRADGFPDALVDDEAEELSYEVHPEH